MPAAQASAEEPSISDRRRGSTRQLRPLHLDGLSPSMSPESSESTTTVFVSNMHCGSCVKTIRDALQSLSPSPSFVDVSIVTQSVTVKHSRALSPAMIKSALDNAGYDILSTPVEQSSPRPQLSWSGSIARLSSLATSKSKRHLDNCAQCRAEQAALTERVGEIALDKDTLCGFVDKEEQSTDTPHEPQPRTESPPTAVPSRVTLSIGGMTCASCSNAITQALSELPNVSDVAVNLLGNSATLVVTTSEVVPTVISTIEDIGYEAEVVSVEPIQPASSGNRPAVSSEDQNGPHRVELSVDGMTCASCSNTVTGLLSDITGVSDVVVNLLGKSATALVENRELVPRLVEAVNDAGYEAEVVNVQPLAAPNTHPAGSTVGPRTVSLRVQGLFCPHCPGKIMNALGRLGDGIEVLKPLTSYTDPILTVSYTPAPPDLTVRSIIRAIESASDSEANFSATIHRPLSLEDRARYMQRREQRSLLFRLTFSVIVAMPTFIIGIVYMSLIPSSNGTRIWFEEPMWVGNVSRAVWALFILATPVMFYSAGTFHRRCLKELYALWRKGSRVPVWKRFVRFGSMNMLVSTGVSVAYFASISLLALAASQSPSSSGRGDTTTYFDSVVFLTMFLLAGRFLEAYSKGRTADAITALGKLRPTSALVVVPASASQSATELSRSTSSNTAAGPHDVEKGDVSAEEHNFASKPGTKVERVAAELLEVGDIVRVLNGASPPADGTIVSGDGGAFDESSLTGESRLVKKQVGDKVFLGTINRAGVVDVRVDEIGGQTMLDYIVKVVREGQTRRAPIERLADIVTGYFVPVVTLLAVVTWVVWLGLGFGGALPQDYLDIDVGGWAVWSLEFAIAVFVVACPCGIGLAAPTALLVGSGLAAKYGILARGGGEAFQETAQLDIIVFDKTGTLTEGGDPKVTNAEVIGDDPARLRMSKEDILGVAMDLESASSHPLAIAICGYCEENRAASHSASCVEETPGRGLKGTFPSLGSTAIIGNEAWLEEHHAEVDGRLSSLLRTWKNEGKSVVLLAVRLEGSEGSSDFAVVAAFAIADPIRREAKEVVSRLQEQGLGTWMISGDNALTAKAVARSVGIPETNVIAEVLPHQKAEKVQWLQQVGMKRPQHGLARLFGRRRLNERCIVAMVGDGINDAPALTAADVGIAIGSGSDVAISSASFILVSSNLRSLLTLSDLSRTVFNRVKFNFCTTWSPCPSLPVSYIQLDMPGSLPYGRPWLWHCLLFPLFAVRCSCGCIVNPKSHHEPVTLYCVSCDISMYRYHHHT
ncbi:E1-E2 ATPase-domain-containing protein [Trametes punicea]|nr:E1-E2 ATPase-domain-containing protein [Trametes punicea]